MSEGRTSQIGKPRRRSIRLPAYDYRWNGAYFVTICAKHRSCLFGDIVAGESLANEFGKIVNACWTEIPSHAPYVMLDAFVLMPNHAHGVLILTETERGTVGARHALPLQSTPLRHFQEPPALARSSVIGSFKSASARKINVRRGTQGTPVWQRNYYEHVVRSEEDLLAIRNYIFENPGALGRG